MRRPGEAFYRGELAQRIAAFAREHNAVLTEADMAAHKNDWCGTIHQDFGDTALHEIPPNGQGIAALMALGIMQAAGTEGLVLDSADAFHLQIEATKLAFADVYAYAADLDYMREVTVAHLLAPSYLASRAKLIDRRKAQDFGAGAPITGGTVCLSTGDAGGMMVSYIQSNYSGFGSGVVVPGTGISLQNRGVGFSMDPKSANVVEGGKRPFHTIIPGFLTRDGAPVMSFGVMGGDMQPQGHLQTVVRMVDYDQQPQAACCAPRWKVNRDFTLDVESTMDPVAVKGLQDLGHTLKSVDDPYMDFGAGQFIWRLSDDREHGYAAASDSRRDGQAVGF